MVHVPASRDQFYKTKMCPHFNVGDCRKGVECFFAHSVDELRVSPNLRKTKLCEEWQRTGSCVRGAACTYAHGEKELRFTRGYFKTDLCKYWKSGVCHAGQECRHAHGSNELRPRKFQETEIERMCTGGIGLAQALGERQPHTGNPRISRPKYSGLIGGQQTPTAGECRGAPTKNVSGLPSPTAECQSGLSSKPWSSNTSASENKTMRHSIVSSEIPLLSYERVPHSHLKVQGNFTNQAQRTWTCASAAAIPDMSRAAATTLGHCPMGFNGNSGLRIMIPQNFSTDNATFSEANTRSSPESNPQQMKCTTIGAMPPAPVPSYMTNLLGDARPMAPIPNPLSTIPLPSMSLPAPCNFVGVDKEQSNMMYQGVYRATTSSNSLSRSSTTCSGSVVQDTSSESHALQEDMQTSASRCGDENVPVVTNTSTPPYMRMICPISADNDSCSYNKQEIVGVPMTWAGRGEDALEIDETVSVFCETNYSTLAQGAGMYGDISECHQSMVHDSEIVSAVVSCVSVGSMEDDEAPSTDVSTDSATDVKVEHEDATADTSLKEYDQVLAATDSWDLLLTERNDLAEMCADVSFTSSRDTEPTSSGTSIDDVQPPNPVKRCSTSNKSRRASQKMPQKEMPSSEDGPILRCFHSTVRIPSPPPIPPPPRDVPPPPSCPPPPPPPEKIVMKQSSLVEKVIDFNAQFPVGSVGKNVRDKFRRKSNCVNSTNIGSKPAPPASLTSTSVLEEKQSTSAKPIRKSGTLTAGSLLPPPPPSYLSGSRKISSCCLIPPPPPETRSTRASSMAGSETSTLPVSYAQGPSPSSLPPHLPCVTCVTSWAGSACDISAPCDVLQDVSVGNYICTLEPESYSCYGIAQPQVPPHSQAANFYVQSEPNFMMETAARGEAIQSQLSERYINYLLPHSSSISPFLSSMQLASIGCKADYLSLPNGLMGPKSASVPLSIQSMLAGVTLEQLQSAQLLPEFYED